MNQITTSDDMQLGALSPLCREWVIALLCEILPRAGGIVLRSNGQMLTQPGFDIDLLLPASELDSLILAVEPDKTSPLLLRQRRGPAGLKLAIFDFSAAATADRPWLLVDIQTHLRLGPHLLSPMDIGCVTRQEQGGAYPVPDPAWQGLLDVVQDYRKSRPPRGEAANKARFRTAHPVVAARLGLSDTHATANLGQQLDIAPYREDKAARKTWRNVLSRWVLCELFFIHRHEVSLFCISGPDGVGKSTLVENTLKLLRYLPLQTTSFHHTKLVKERMAAQSEKPSGMMWRLMRLFSPETLRRPLRTLLGEYGYAKNLNREIANQYLTGHLTVTDRYAYDRCLKMHLHRKGFLQRALAWATVLFMRRPLLLIVPVDTPAAIRSRKTELTEAEISWYYAQLHRIVLWRRIETLWLPLPMAAQDLAQHAARAILVALGDELFTMIGKYERARKVRE